MTRARAAALVAVLLLGAGFAIRWQRGAGPAATAPVSTAPFAESAWPKGTRTTYHVAWKTSASATVENAREGALETRFDVEGDLRIDAYGARDEGIALGLRWTRLDRAVAEALGKPVAAPGALETQLVGAETVVVLEPSGRVRQLGFSDATTPLARLVLRAIVLDLTAEIAAGAGAVDVVDTALGRARVGRIDGGGPATSRSGYDELDAFPGGLEATRSHLDARGEVSLGTGGAVDRVTSREELELEASGGMLSGYRSSTSLTASVLGRTKADGLTLPSYAPAAIRMAIDAGYDRRASLERRSLGVTPSTLRSDVRSAALFPRAGTTQWIWRDAAYLELHPEEAEPLLAAAAELDVAGLAAAFDVVVISGTEQGQAALVRALEGPAAASEDAFVVLVQRLSHVVRPTPSLVAFVARERARFRGTDRGHAAAYTLGALTYHLAAEQPDAAEAIARELAADLQAAKSTDDRVSLLAALGNAGRSSTVDAVVAHARDPDVAVRREVASSLRKMEAPAVVDALLELVVDAAPEVASVAIDSLLRKQLDDGDWATLARHVGEGHVPAETHASLVSGLARRRGDDAGADLVLRAMSESAHVGPDAKQRIDAVLRE